jgi:hypothetical protein
MLAANRHASQDPLDILARWLPQAWLGSTLLMLLLLVVRRLSGAFTTPLEFTPALLLGFMAAIYAWQLRARLRGAEGSELSHSDWDRYVSGGTWLLLVTIALPGTPALHVLALCFPWAAAEAYWWCVQREALAAVPLSHAPREALAAPEPHQASAAEEELEPDDAERKLIASQRHYSTSSYELVQGTLSVVCQPDEQTAVVHIPFHPPLQHDPELIAEVAEPGWTIRVTDVRAFGARLEVRRRTPSPAPSTLQLTYEALVEIA